jgi:hypothetical protein
LKGYGEIYDYNFLAQFLESKLNIEEQLYIPQKIKFKMIEFYQKIGKIYDKTQIQYAEYLLQSEIYDLNFEAAAVIHIKRLKSINKPVHQLSKEQITDAKLYLKEAEDFFQRSQLLINDPQINNKSQIDKIKADIAEISEKYQPIAMRFLVDEYIKIFEQESLNLPPNDARFNDTKKLLENLNKFLKGYGEIYDYNFLAQFLESKLNIEEQLYIPQKIKFKMIEFYQKIGKIYDKTQIQYAEYLLQSEIQKLNYEPFPFFINVKNILDEPISDLVVKHPNILQEIASKIQEANVLLQMTQKLKNFAINDNKRIILPEIEIHINMINERMQELQSLREDIENMYDSLKKCVPAFEKDLRKELDQYTEETLDKFITDYKSALNTFNLPGFLESKLNPEKQNNLPQGIKIKLLILVKSTERIITKKPLSEEQIFEPKPPKQRQPVFFSSQNNSLAPERELETQKNIVVEKYENVQEALSHQINNYLAQRKINNDQYINRCIPVKLSIAFGACSLREKAAAAIDLNKAINGEITIEDLENDHKKALNQGNLGKLYKELKPKLLAMGDIKKVIDGKIDLATFETKHKKAIAKGDFASFYQEIKPNLLNLLITEKNIRPYLNSISL